jgi:hypothetical protein
MQRILLVETASPLRVRKKAEEIAAGSLYGDADLTILCRDDLISARELGGVKTARVISLAKNRKSAILREIKLSTFDVVCCFWTGERRYRAMKLRALRIPARIRDIDIGDGHVFRLTPGNFVRFLSIRWKYPLPSDHRDFVLRGPEPHPDGLKPGLAPSSIPEAGSEAEPPRYGEEIVVVQSAEPSVVLRAMESLKDAPLFRNPRYTLFCRSRPEALSLFRAHPGFYGIIEHSETRGAFKHLLDLRRKRFDSAVVFFTGDHSYWKIKCLPFLLGTRHTVVFNENCDCFYFSWRAWFSHISHRLSQSLVPGMEPHWVSRARALAVAGTKIVLLPLRFIYLLLVWLWLRGTNLRPDN